MGLGICIICFEISISIIYVTGNVLSIEMEYLLINSQAYLR